MAAAAEPAALMRVCMSRMFRGNDDAVDLAMGALTDVALRPKNSLLLTQLLPKFVSNSVEWPPSAGSTVTTEAATYTLVKKLGKGSYGVAYATDDTTVLKLALDLKGDAALASAMILEAIVHTFMQCLQSRYTCALPFPIPEINALGWLTNNQAPVIVMAAVGRSVHIELPTLTELQLVNIIFQVCYHLRCLQAAFGFAHKDLNLGNVMIQKRAAPLDVMFEGVRMRLDHDVYFIDFGTTCLNTRSCATCSDESDVFRKMNPILSALEFETVNMMRSDACTNTSFDVRLFLGGLLFELLPRFGFRQVRTWLESMIDRATFPLFYSSIGDDRFFSFYRDSSVVHPHLLPDAVFQSLRYIRRNLERSVPPPSAAAPMMPAAAVSSVPAAAVSSVPAASSSAGDAAAHAAAIQAAMAALAERESHDRVRRSEQRKRKRDGDDQPPSASSFFGFAAR